MKNIKKIFYLLSSHERKRAGLLLLMILIMALLDTIGVASILPFMTVLTNPDVIETNIILNKMLQFSKIFGVQNNQDFLFVLGIFVFVLLVTSLAFKALTSYFQARFVLMREYSIGKRLVENYLNQPYSWFLNQHSADLGKTILSEVNQIVGKGISPLMSFIAQSMVAAALICLLILVDTKLALIIGFLLAGSYLIIYFLIKNLLNRIGKARLESNHLRFVSVIEAFSASKEIKVGGFEQAYLKRFSDPAQIFAKSQAIGSIIGQLPRYALEVIAFGGIMLLILFMMKQTGSLNNSLPIISLYVFAGYRLMPALHHIYLSFTQFSLIGPSLDKLNEDIKNLQPIHTNQNQDIILHNKAITLNNVSYNYPNSSRIALKDINLTIPSKKTIGFVGTSGSGKTTTVDIILGLLEAQKGTLKVDDQIIKKDNIKAWQRTIGYVPQHIYLSDDTIGANIAFGIDPEDINQEAILRASKIANLHEFIINELPKKYQTIIGENGVRLSGGQRQRIGVARALYNRPKVLILDEATSALDDKTEKLVMNEINNLSKDITIIIIAHRLSTLENCNKIFLFDKGKIINSGTFEELIKINKTALTDFHN